MKIFTHTQVPLYLVNGNVGEDLLYLLSHPMHLRTQHGVGCCCCLSCQSLHVLQLSGHLGSVLNWLTDHYSQCPLPIAFSVTPCNQDTICLCMSGGYWKVHVPHVDVYLVPSMHKTHCSLSQRLRVETSSNNSTVTMFQLLVVRMTTQIQICFIPPWHCYKILIGMSSACNSWGIWSCFIFQSLLYINITYQYTKKGSHNWNGEVTTTCSETDKNYRTAPISQSQCLHSGCD